jgi:hypothetical protein
MWASAVDGSRAAVHEERDTDAPAAGVRWHPACHAGLPGDASVAPRTNR